MNIDIIHAGQLAGAIGTILGLAGLIVKWTIVKPIKTYIDVMTYPIQGHANGGKSLPDVARKLDDLHDLFKDHVETHHRGA